MKRFIEYITKPNWPMVVIAYLLATGMLCSYAFLYGRVYEQCHGLHLVRAHQRQLEAMQQQCREILEKYRRVDTHEISHRTADALREHFDLLEVNHFWQETCETDRLTHRLSFVQILFRNWEPVTEEFEIHAWRMLKSFPVEERPALDELPEDLAAALRLVPVKQRTLMAPELNQATGKYEMRWHDNDVLRVVTADSIRVTNTTHDPEIVERERWAKEKRRELRKAVR